MKTVRVAQIIGSAGRPTVHLSWIEPTRDPALTRAVHEHRVVTVHQRARGGKNDYGVVGLEPARDAQYLIFPKSLRAFENHRIVAIRYAELGQSLSLGSLRPARRRKSRTPPTAGPPPPPLKRVPPKPERTIDPNVKRRSPAPKPEVLNDPILREVHRALSELRADERPAAERRLERLLARSARE